MGMDINNSGNAGTKDETRGTRTNGGVSEMRQKYSDFKNPFHTNPKCSVRGALHYSVGIPLSFGGVIHSTYPWLQDCSLGHVIWATGCRDMVNLKQQYHGKDFLTFELMTRISVKS